MHLNDHQIITILGGAEHPHGRQHLLSCTRCREVADLWQSHIGDLRLLASQTVDKQELHKLRVLFREHSGSDAGLTTWIAELIRSSLRPATAAVRGATGAMMELAAGPYRVVLQTSPHEIEGAVSLHGQLLNEDPDAVVRGKMVISGPSGAGFLSTVNDHGEFHINCLPTGTYSASWWIPEGRIQIDEIRVGNGASS